MPSQISSRSASSAAASSDLYVKHTSMLMQQLNITVEVNLGCLRTGLRARPPSKLTKLRAWCKDNIVNPSHALPARSDSCLSLKSATIVSSTQNPWSLSFSIPVTGHYTHQSQGEPYRGPRSAVGRLACEQAVPRETPDDRSWQAD